MRQELNTIKAGVLEWSLLNSSDVVIQKKAF